MSNASILQQTRVYFKKFLRLAFRESAWIFVLFAVIISLIVTFVTADNMFDNLDNTKSGFFTLASACIWIGVFNSIQSVCREHKIIRSEIRQGSSVTAYILAHVLWQALLCFVQSVIIFGICCAFKYFGKNVKAVVGNGYLEYFLTIFLLTFGSAVLGIMVSSFSGSPTTAMKIMPFILIIQLIMSGVLFELTGFAKKIANVTYSKWGMSAFGSIGNLNGLDPKIADTLKEKIPSFDPDLIQKTEDLYEHSTKVLMTAWGWCIGLTVLFIVISIVCLKLRNRDS